MHTSSTHLINLISAAWILELFRSASTGPSRSQHFTLFEFCTSHYILFKTSKPMHFCFDWHFPSNYCHAPVSPQSGRYLILPGPAIVLPLKASISCPSRRTVTQRFLQPNAIASRSAVQSLQKLYTVDPTCIQPFLPPQDIKRRIISSNRYGNCLLYTSRCV